MGKHRRLEKKMAQLLRVFISSLCPALSDFRFQLSQALLAQAVRNSLYTLTIFLSHILTAPRTDDLYFTHPILSTKLFISILPS